MGKLRRVLFATLTAVLAASAISPVPAADGPVKAKKPKGGAIKLPGGEVVEPHVPLKPETKAQKAHREALALYMSGRLREAKNDFRGAYADYQKAIAVEPKAVAVYRALVPLAFGLGKQEDAIKFAHKAIELDPNDFSLLRQLGVFMAAQNKIPQAVKLLEQASQSKSLDKTSLTHVTLKRDLAILYGGMLRLDKTNKELKKKVADAYQVVFDARTNPKKYELDDATTRRLQADPISSYERIGEAFLEADRPSLAIRAFESAQKEGKGRPGSLSYNLARVYFQTKQFDKSLEHLQKYFDTRLQSKGRDAYQLLADILKEQGRSKNLVGRLELLVKNDSNNSTLKFFLAEQYAAAKQLKKAEALYIAALKQDDSPEGHVGLAAIHRQQGKTAEWLAEIKAVLKGANSADKLEAALSTAEPELKSTAKDEKFAKAVLDIGLKRIADKANPLDLQESMVLGQVAADAKQTKSVIAFYNRALETGPKMASTIYEQLGGHLLDVRDYAEAAKVYRKAATDPALARSKPNYLYRLSQAEELAGNTKAAVDAIHEAQKILPGISLLHFQEAWIYYHARQYDRAIPLFEKVISQFPTDANIIKQCRFSLSNIYVQQGDRRKGEQILEQVYADNPDDPSVNNDLGYLWAEKGKNLEQAEKMIRKALAAEPDNAAYQDSMGWVLYMRKKYTEALPYLLKSAKAPQGGDATIWDHLADCYLKLNKKTEAIDAWNKALKDARKSKKPDEKLIKKIEAKLKAAK